MTTTTVVVQSSSAVATLVTQTNTVIAGGIVGPRGPAAAISESGDVDTSNLQDGSTLVYDTSAGKWQATNLLEKQVINAGFF